MENETLSFGVGILAWKAPVTLEKTLKAFSAQILANRFQDAVVFFQEMSDEDRAVAQRYGFRAVGNDQNVGILQGIKSAVQAVRSDVVLFLECDCLLIEEAATARRILIESADDIRSGRVQVMRLRHLENPGDDYGTTQKYFRYWSYGNTASLLMPRLLRTFRPFKAQRLIGEACRTGPNPEDVFPRHIKRLADGHFCVDSSALSWTNQSIMVNKKWFLETIIPYAESHVRSRGVNGFPDLEKEMNCHWWRKQHFNVGWADPGLFSHHRVDRPDTDEKGEPLRRMQEKS